MKPDDSSILISYAWGAEREEIVNKLDQSLQKRGLKIIRDKRDLGYKGSIKEFMEQIGQGHCIIVVVSDKYLRSPNCMFELVEIAENKQLHDRIFPIVLSDADIYDPVRRLEYVKYWEAKRAELAKAMKDVDPANLQGLREDIDDYDRFRDKISGLTSILKDMNTLTPEMHRDSDFDALYTAIEKRLGEVDPQGGAMFSSDSSAKPEGKPQLGNDRPSIQVGNISNSTGVGIGSNIQQDIHITQGSSADEIARAFSTLMEAVQAKPAGPIKTVAETAVKGLEAEAAKGEQADESNVQQWFTTLAQMAPDILEVAVNTFINPISGLSTIFQKIAKRAKQG